MPQDAAGEIVTMFSVSLVSSVVLTSIALGQLGGGSATFSNQGGRSGAEVARAAELAKRVVPNSDGKYIDAAILINVEADEYIAVFGVSQEGETLAESQTKMDSAVSKFVEALRRLSVNARDIHVDFVSQNRIYGFENVDPNMIRERVVGYEVKKTVAIRYEDKDLLERMTLAAAEQGIFDLVKVDYVVKDFAPLRKQLMEEAGKIIRAKVADQEALLGVPVGRLTVAVPGLMSAYYPVEMYDSYTAQESEEVMGYRPNTNVLRARKSRTFYYNPMLPKDFDAVINPGMIEPGVQVTIYVRLKY